MLEGDRVRLRALRPEDTKVLWEFWADPDVSARASNRPPRPYSLEETEALFAELAKREDLMRFAIEAEGEVIGECSLHDVDRFNRCCEVGITIGKPYWAQGFGQESLRLLVDYAFRYHNMHRVGLEALADDPRAVGCYRKVGFVEEGTLRKRDWAFGEYHDVLVMSILDEEWTS
jgi:RimJ/RimL family protein N-acetyltransferase